MVQRFFRESMTERLRRGVFASVHKLKVAIYNGVARPHFSIAGFVSQRYPTRSVLGASTSAARMPDASRRLGPPDPRQANEPGRD